jgi:hypothetical protein
MKENEAGKFGGKRILESSEKTIKDAFFKKKLISF